MCGSDNVCRVLRQIPPQCKPQLIATAPREKNGQCEFAGSDKRLEQDGFESPSVRNPRCVRSDKLHCIPSPCTVLTMSYFRDPMAESSSSQLENFNHTCCIGADKSDDPSCEDTQCTDRVFVGTEYEQHRSLQKIDGQNYIIGHSTCDAQFGTEVFRYKGNTDRFTITKETTRCNQVHVAFRLPKMRHGRVL